jgi:CRISPR system Cascade subunit CasE
MYLSRLILESRSRQVQRELARPYEMHRTLLRAFPDNLAVDDERLLFRVEAHPRTGVPMILVHSRLRPDWSRLPTPGYLADDPIRENPAVKEVTLRLQPGQLLSFRLLANPTKRLSKSLPRGMEKSKRVGLADPEEQMQWLARKGEQHGFRLVQATATGQASLADVVHKGEKTHKLTLLGVRFDGLLQVADPVQLTEAVASGIGSGKAFGFGLLSLASA